VCDLSTLTPGCAGIAVCVAVNAAHWLVVHGTDTAGLAGLGAA
jgi:hypothetical protein